MVRRTVATASPCNARRPRAEGGAPLHGVGAWSGAGRGRAGAPSAGSSRRRHLPMAAAPGGWGDERQRRRQNKAAEVGAGRHVPQLRGRVKPGPAEQCASMTGARRAAVSRRARWGADVGQLRSRSIATTIRGCLNFFNARLNSSSKMCAPATARPGEAAQPAAAGSPLDHQPASEMLTQPIP